MCETRKPLPLVAGQSSHPDLASISTETNELTQDGQQREQVAEILEGTAFAAFLPTVLKAVC